MNPRNLFAWGMLLMPLAAATATSKSGKKSAQLRGAEDDDGDENPATLREVETPGCIYESVLYEDPTDTESTFINEDETIIILNKVSLL